MIKNIHWNNEIYTKIINYMKHLKRINEEVWIRGGEPTFKSFQEEYDFIQKKLKEALDPNKVKFGSFEWHSPMSHIEGTYTDNIYFDMSIPKSKDVKKVEKDMGGFVLDTSDISYMSLISKAIESILILSFYKSVLQFNKGDKDTTIRVIFYREGKYKP